MSKENLSLKCGACGHDNEPERVYCHNCGQKLDRSLLPAPEVRKEHESDGQKHRRVQKMMQVGNRQGWVMRDLKTFIKVLVFAAIVAALTLFFLKPDDVPDIKSVDIPEHLAGEAWEQMMGLKTAQRISFTEGELNYYLKSAIKAADSSIPGVKFVRAFVNFHAGPDGAPGTITITSQRDAWGLAVYSSATFAPRERDGRVDFQVVGVRFGRLGLHPSLKFVSGFALDSLKKVFEKEIGQLSRLKSVLPGDKVIVLETNPQP